MTSASRIQPGATLTGSTLFVPLGEILELAGLRDILFVAGILLGLVLGTDGFVLSLGQASGDVRFVSDLALLKLQCVTTKKGRRDRAIENFDSQTMERIPSGMRKAFANKLLCPPIPKNQATINDSLTFFLSRAPYVLTSLLGAKRSIPKI